MIDPRAPSSQRTFSGADGGGSGASGGGFFGVFFGATVVGPLGAGGRDPRAGAAGSGGGGAGREIAAFQAVRTPLAAAATRASWQQNGAFDSYS